MAHAGRILLIMSFIVSNFFSFLNILVHETGSVLS